MYVRPRYRRSASSAAGADPVPAPVEQVHGRSHLAVIPALLLLGLGWYLARYSIIFPAVLGFFLLSGALGLLGSRVNPLSTGFYLTTKPSWTAIGTVFFAGSVLMWLTYEFYVHAWGPVIPHLPAF